MRCAVAPAGDAHSDLYYISELGRRLKALYAESADPKDRPILDLTWDYASDDPVERALREPSAQRVLQEINGYHTAPGRSLADSPQVRDFDDLREDGSTACGAWIYAGVYPDKETNVARARSGDTEAALGWGFAWPANRRMLYNRASADKDGKPWSERKRYMSWDAEKNVWVGARYRRLPAAQVALRRSETRCARLRCVVRERSVHHAEGRPRAALRLRYPQGRPVAGALRTRRIDHAQSGLQAAEQSDAARMGSRR